jgi:hypothetical protein
MDEKSSDDVDRRQLLVAFRSETVFSKLAVLRFAEERKNFKRITLTGVGFSAKILPIRPYWVDAQPAILGGSAFARRF